MSVKILNKIIEKQRDVNGAESVTIAFSVTVLHKAVLSFIKQVKEVFRRNSVLKTVIIQSCEKFCSCFIRVFR